MKNGKPWRRAILHIDMDAFYASVEQLDNPSLRGKPLIVGGSPQARGVVAAASYEVRPYGVRSAMPTARALRLCPRAILIPPRMERYQEVSGRVFAIFERFTPLIQPVSLDEAFLDVTGSQMLHGDAVAIARTIRAAIKAETGLTGSAGVSSCRFAAKIASDLDKPDGLTVIPENEIMARLAPLPVGKIWGVGPVTNRKLEQMGIRTIADLRDWPVPALTARLGSAGAELHDLANGIDDSAVIPDEAEKSVSHENTFERDVTDLSVLEGELLDLSGRVAARLRGRGLAGRTICLKLRYSDFTTLTRRTTLSRATCVGEIIYRSAKQLLRERTEAGRRPVRLIGVGVSGLRAGPGQGSLFTDSGDGELGLDETRRERLERAVDGIRLKMGKGAIERGTVRFRE